MKGCLKSQERCFFLKLLIRKSEKPFREHSLLIAIVKFSPALQRFVCFETGTDLPLMVFPRAVS